MFAYYQNNPPELARVTALKVGYYKSRGGWTYSSSIPSTARSLRVCGIMEKSKAATLQFTISEPNDKNIFIHQDEYLFELQPGEFCINLSLVDNVVPGNYTLWVIDARTTVAKLDIIFLEDKLLP